MLNQIIIVEGKTDTNKLKKIFGNEINTIETNGLALNKQTLEAIKKLSKSNELIVFTDPDGPGKIIREKIANVVEGNILNAFINKEDFNESAKKIGVAEADEQAIKNALNNVIKTNPQNKSISWNEYVNNDMYLKSNRKLILSKLKINMNLSSKSLFKWLNWMQLTTEDIEKLMKE